MNRKYAYLRNDRKVKFRIASAQHFINEAPGDEENVIFYNIQHPLSVLMFTLKFN